MAFVLQNGKWVQTGKPTQAGPPAPTTDVNALTDKAFAEYNDAIQKYKAANKGVNPPDEYVAGLTAAYKSKLDEIARIRQAQINSNITAANNMREDKLLKDELARDDKIRAAALAASQAAAGSAAKQRAEERRDRLAKEKRDNAFQIAEANRNEQFRIDGENRQNARQDALEAIARVRGIEGAEYGAELLESDAGKRTLDGLARIKELYDPMKNMADSEFATQLDLLSKDFEMARGQVETAGKNFLESFVDSVAYKDVPISTFDAPTNPLLASLKAQGAGTGEVEAVSNFAKQFATSSSDLGKWAASQLNVGQQNFDIASKRAATGATTSALQGLAGQEPRIKAGMQQDMNKRLQDIAMQRASAEENVYNREADTRDRANILRAEALSKYGKNPKTTEEEDTSTEGDTAAKEAAAAEAKRKAEEEKARLAGIGQAKAARTSEF